MNYNKKCKLKVIIKANYLIGQKTYHSTGYSDTLIKEKFYNDGIKLMRLPIYRKKI